MSDATESWRRQTDEQVIAAMLRLGDFLDEGQTIIRAEMLRRGLMLPHPGIHIYRVDSRQLGMMDIASVLPSEVVSQLGIVTEAIIGRLRRSATDGGTLSPENFDANPLFADVLHQVVARHAPTDSDLMEEARRIDHGKVYVIDGRTPAPDGRVPAEDIIGSFVAETGRVHAGSYERNPNHIVLSPIGFFRLGPALHQRLVEELEQRTREWFSAGNR